MSRVHAVCAVLLIGLNLASTEVRAADRTQLSQLKTALAPKKSVSPHLRASECVQKNPAITLRDSDKKITPSVAGFIYFVEQKEDDRLLVSDLNEGLRGWVSPGEMVPLADAEAYIFSADQARSSQRVRLHDARGCPPRES